MCVCILHMLTSSEACYTGFYSIYIFFVWLLKILMIDFVFKKCPRAEYRMMKLKTMF